MNYGTVPLSPVMFQDDLADSSENLTNARETNKRVDLIVKQRRLDLNREKNSVHNNWI